MSDKSSADQQLNEMSRFRLFLAIVVPGFVAGLVVSVAYLLLNPDTAGRLLLLTGEEIFRTDPSLAEVAMANLMLIGLGVLIGGLWGLFAMIVLGLPAHAILMRRFRAAAWAYAVVGLILGAAIPAVMTASLLLSPYNSSSEVFQMIGLCAIGGSVAGLTFWLIRRPDRDVPAASPS